MTPEDSHEKGAKGKLACLRATLLPNCREMSRHSSRALDGPLPFFQRLGAVVHLLFCRLCRRYRTQLRWIHTVAPECDTAPAAPSHRLPDGSRSRLKQSLRQYHNHLVATQKSPERPTPSQENGHDHHC